MPPVAERRLTSGVTAGELHLDHHGDNVDKSRHAGPNLGDGDYNDPDVVEMVTIGVDVGSSTSHLLCSKVRLQRLATKLSSRYVVVARHVLWSSPVTLTPYRNDGLIDAGSLRSFIAGCYERGGMKPTDVDSGAVILTGEALRRANAASIAEAVATDTGRFVCASAGHHLEAVLAAEGSGAVARSAGLGTPTLHVDVGGGTSKLALLEGGRVLATSALAVGGRLVAYDAERRLTRVEPTLIPLLDHLGMQLSAGQRFSEEAEDRVAAGLAEMLAAAILGSERLGFAKSFELTSPLPYRPRAASLTFSGGVAEYLADPEHPRFGDLASALAGHLRPLLERAQVEIATVAHRIRATVTGASQFSVQVSGNTIFAAEDQLPIRNLPVVPFALAHGNVEAAQIGRRLCEDLRRRSAGTEDPRRPGLALSWAGDPSYPRLASVAAGIVEAWSTTPGTGPSVVAIDHDVAASLARALLDAGAEGASLVVLDGLELGELDFVDIGGVVRPSGVATVVIKSLLFAGRAAPGR